MGDAVQILDYPVNPRPRWGYGQPTHKLIADALDRNRASYLQTLDSFTQFKGLLHSIPSLAVDQDLLRPYWNQVWFSCLDAAALVCLLGHYRPARFIEIGSGNSTKFARFAVESLSLTTHITSIDPSPRTAIDRLCDQIIRQSLESCDLSLFDALSPGDILFFDGSHRVFTNSDVAVFFLEVLPRLKNGVIVQVHDIFLPDDYPPAWNGLYYSEQYILAAFLMQRAPSISVVLPNYFICKDAELRGKVLELFTAGTSKIEMTYANAGNTPGVSFWFETRFH